MVKPLFDSSSTFGIWNGILLGLNLLYSSTPHDVFAVDMIIVGVGDNDPHFTFDT